ncbi:MAG: hypothetical protein M0Q46_02065 [Endomicrobiales bacterium]|nr:hypothetical protein [Endomicrobiales bacterium]
MPIIHIPKFSLTVYAVKLFLLFFLIFIILQIIMYIVSKAILPYQIFVEAGGWVFKTTMLIFIETVITSFISAGLCLIFVHRTIGSIPRLTNQLAEMEKTGKITQLRIRDDDKLSEFVSVINRIIEKNSK